jgi:hypothetical protein
MGVHKRNHSIGWLCQSVLVMLTCSFALGQNPQLRPENARRFPLVVFTSVFWTANPSYYSIAIDSAGTATYQSAPDSVEHSGVPYTVEFHVSDRTRRATFNMARNLDFFREAIPVSTGSPETSMVRTLAYHDPAFNAQITYTSSPDPNLQELTSILEETCETLEFGRKLNYFHAHDPRALEPELIKMQGRIERHRLRDLQALVPTLNGIATDSAVEQSARQRAQELLRRTQ